MPKYVDVERIHAQIMDAFETALEVIETENAVEVVRCKDCDFICPGNACPVCTNWGRNTDYDGWCYMGERREENAAD